MADKYIIISLSIDANQEFIIFLEPPTPLSTFNTCAIIRAKLEYPFWGNLPSV